MKHLIWGSLSAVIGVFLLISSLVLANVTIGTNLIYGGIFVAYGIYRINQYREFCKQNSKENNVQSNIDA